jgi:hypothetical protein
MKIQPRHDPLVAIVSLFAVACSGMSDPGMDGGTPADPPIAATTEPLCDGSAGPRLTFKIVGGFVESPFFFYAAHGYSFFAIDGTCRYWAGAGSLGEVRTGTLSAAQAAEVEDKLHWKLIPGLSAYPDRESCPDAGASLLGAGDKVISCTCGCNELPAEIPDAFAKVSAVHEGLFARGTSQDLPLRAATLPADEEAKVHPAPNIQVWPLSSSPAALAAGAGEIMPSSGRAIEDPADRASLRALRRPATIPTSHQIIFVRDGTNGVFRLLLRDEPPAAVVRALADLSRR